MIIQSVDGVVSGGAGSAQMGGFCFPEMVGFTFAHSDTIGPSLPL